MADLYLMEDLKEAVSSSIGKRLNKDNLLETFQLGEKYTAQKLKELCRDFIDNNMKLLEFANRRLDIANKILAANLDETFKKREDFLSDMEYRSYMRASVKPNMIVRCRTRSRWERVKIDEDDEEEECGPDCELVREGEIGRVVSFPFYDEGIKVKWQSGKSTIATNRGWLEILTSPISTKMFE